MQGLNRFKFTGMIYLHKQEIPSTRQKNGSALIRRFRFDMYRKIRPPSNVPGWIFPITGAYRSDI